MLINFFRKSKVIPLLAGYYCRSAARKHNREILKLAPDAMELLINASRPGNIRHLLNAIEKCAVFSDSQVISRKLLVRVLRLKSDKLLSLNEAWDEYERDYLIRLLNLTEGDIALAAHLSQRNRNEFSRLLRNHGLDPDQFRDQAL